MICPKYVCPNGVVPGVFDYEFAVGVSYNLAIGVVKAVDRPSYIPV